MHALVERHSPDVIGLQETKVQDSEFPMAIAEEIGYHCEIHGQKGHYGVAMLSRKPPLKMVRGLPGDKPDEQRRLLRGLYQHDELGEVWVFNGYFPQGESRHHETKFPYKQDFYNRLIKTLATDYDPAQQLVVMGDLNISPQDIDIGIGEQNRLRWLRDGKCSFLPEEREMLKRLYSWGLHDSFRLCYPDVNDVFSWFDYRSRGFDDTPKRGLRIDQIWVTEPLRTKVKSAGVDYEMRAMEKPSDHCPVWTSFGI